MILEELGPKRKVFEDLEPGDYFFEIAEPGDKGWLLEVVDSDDHGNPTDAKAQYVNWPLRVLRPEESEGRRFYHLTMVGATDEKIAKAKRSYDPAAFTYQFLADVGVGLLQSGEVTILDDYLTQDCLDLNKTIGISFWGSIRKGANPKQPERVGLTKVWLDK
jgi:hypothetical protein